MIQGTGGVEQNAIGTWFLGGTNTYTGTTSLTSGTMSTISAFAMSPSSAVSFDGPGTALYLNGNSQTIGGLSGGTANVPSLLSLGVATLTINQKNSGIYYGTINGGAGSLVLNGTGSLSLVGLTSYTGSTTINGGYLGIRASTLAQGSGVTLMRYPGYKRRRELHTPDFLSGANTSLIQTGGGGLITLNGNNSFGGSSLQLLSGGLLIDDTSNNGPKLMRLARPHADLRQRGHLGQRQRHDRGGRQRTESPLAAGRLPSLAGATRMPRWPWGRFPSPAAPR